MGLDRRDIRHAMDVYTRDNVYLGTVLDVLEGPARLVGECLPPAGRPTSAVSGEALGPMPTEALGNVGPRTQAARVGYGVATDHAAPLGHGAIVVGRWWGLVGRRTLPLDWVQTVTLERIVLRLRRAELPR